MSEVSSTSVSTPTTSAVVADPAERNDVEVLRQLFDPATRPDPYPVLGELRAASPLPVMNGDLVVVGRYADCRQVLRDPTVANDPRKSRLGAAIPQRQESLLFLDPPAHTRIRRLVSKAFSPRVVAAIEPRIGAIVDDLILAVSEKSSFDVVTDFAFPLPVQIMCQLLGIPVAEYEVFEPAARRLGRVLDYDLVFKSEDLDDAEGARTELMAYLRDLIRRRRQALGDDLLSELIQVEEQGEVLTEAELLATCVLLMVAGHETTANLISNGVLALLKNPDALAALRAGGGAGIADEVLRYDPPVQFVMRMATTTMHVNNLEITPRTAMLVLLAAANRDPEQYPDPDRFDVERSASDHLAFSSGAHFCLAAALGRSEASIALSAFARRIVNPVLEQSSVVYSRNVNLRGMKQLIVSHSGVV